MIAYTFFKWAIQVSSMCKLLHLFFNRITFWKGTREQERIFIQRQACSIAQDSSLFSIFLLLLFSTFLTCSFLQLPPFVEESVIENDWALQNSHACIHIDRVPRDFTQNETGLFRAIWRLRCCIMNVCCWCGGGCGSWSLPCNFFSLFFVSIPMER